MMIYLKALSFPRHYSCSVEQDFTLIHSIWQKVLITEHHTYAFTLNLLSLSHFNLHFTEEAVHIFHPLKLNDQFNCLFFSQLEEIECGWMGGRMRRQSLSVRFRADFIWATVSYNPSQMCVFSQVLVFPKLCVLCEGHCAYGCVRMCDINLDFIHFSHRWGRTASAWQTISYRNILGVSCCNGVMTAVVVVWCRQM